jgi:hypothetical protein
MLAAVIHLCAEIRSFERAHWVMKQVIGQALSAKTIERLAHQVGQELQQENQVPTGKPEVVIPEVAVVSSDGGRIQTRAADAGPGVHDAAWHETKNASFERMSGKEMAPSDPCESLPDTFRRVGHVAKIAEKSPFAGVFTEADHLPLPAYQGPKRILRTCISSMAHSEEFGRQMRREAERRRFYEAGRRVFIGDGLAWNWSIWRTHFPTFTPILDFIHAVQYVYSAAEAWESDGPTRWKRYLQLAEAIWQGRIDEVIEALRIELVNRGLTDEDDLPDGDPLQTLIDTKRYLTNNRTRMDYAQYRREGLPITSSPMESLIKQINHRVKGTEMFWLHPEGAEAILQIRAASLCEDGRLEEYLRRRPGHPFVRRPRPNLAT